MSHPKKDNQHDSSNNHHHNDNHKEMDHPPHYLTTIRKRTSFSRARQLQLGLIVALVGLVATQFFHASKAHLHSIRQTSHNNHSSNDNLHCADEKYKDSRFCLHHRRIWNHNQQQREQREQQQQKPQKQQQRRSHQNTPISTPKLMKKEAKAKHQATRQQDKNNDKEIHKASHSNVKKDRSNDDGPLFVMHVGLPKTATTHLQCSLCGHASATAPLLARDDFVYLGTCPGECVRNNDDDENDDGDDDDDDDDDDDIQPFLKHTHGAFFAKQKSWKYPTEPHANPLGAFPHALDENRTTSTTRDDRNEIKLSARFVRRLKRLHKAQTNVVIVFEGADAWSAQHIQVLAGHLQQHGWRPHIVVAYRPLFDWLPSKYNSVIKPSRNRAARVWPGLEYKLGYTNGGTTSPWLVGEEIPPFSLQRNLSGGHSPSVHRGTKDDSLFGDYIYDIEQRYQMHPTHMVVSNYQTYFSNVHVMSLPHLSSSSTKAEKGDPLLEYLFCKLLPNEMPHTCQTIQRGKFRGGVEQSTKGLANPSVELDYDILAVHAFRRGWIPVYEKGLQISHSPTRDHVVRHLENWHKKQQSKHEKELEFASSCLDNVTLARLENTSWKLERKLFLEHDTEFSSEKETEYQVVHHAGLQKSISKGKYCSIDAEKTLDAPEWRQFFADHYQKHPYIDYPKHLPKERPLFILHVGLPKTATTHIQCSLCEDPNKKEQILLKDELVYLGTCPSSDCRITDDDRFLDHTHNQFFYMNQNNEYSGYYPFEPKGSALGPFPHTIDPNRTSTRPTIPHLKEEFMEWVEEARKEGHSAMLVFEGFDALSKRHIAALSQFLDKQLWEVHVVVAYRPLYDWLPSKYNSVNKPNRNQAAFTWPGLLDSEALVYGEDILPFALDNRSAGHTEPLRRYANDSSGFSDFVKEIEVEYKMHPAQMAQLNYAQFFEHVHIMPTSDLTHSQNMGEIPKTSDPLLDFLFCQMLPGRFPHICRNVQNGSIGSGGDKQSRTNPSVELKYDMLAVQAYKEGLIDVVNERPWREHVAKAVKRRQENEEELSGTDFPQTCMDDATLKRFRDLSWMVEKRLFFGVVDDLSDTTSNYTWLDKNGESAQATNLQEYHSKLAEYQERHEAAFAKVVASKKFCNVDPQKALKQNGWRQWFKDKYK